MQQPDNLFRDKLGNFQLDAPANAWSRIESGLDKSSNKGLWLKIAAGFLLLSVATVLIWKSSSKEVGPSIANNTVPKETKMPARESTPSAPQKGTDNQLQNHQEEKNDSPIKASIKKKKHVPVPVPENTVAHVDGVTDREKIVDAGVSLPVSDVLTAKEANEVAPETTNVQSGVYLVYTAEEVNKKYLRKQPEEDATTDDKKSSRMQMLMGVANNLKNGDNGIGDLRQIKDEIFALNFLDKKEHTKKNN